MYLKPKKTKHTKYHHVKRTRTESMFRYPKFGRYALISQETVYFSACQIEACRKILSRYFKRKGKIWICAFPHYPLTTKPSDLRMGGGKGSNIKKWVSFIRSGKILFEADGISYQKAIIAFEAAKKKLPFKTFFYHNSSIN